jgi:AcrR family transcriptional regulator
MNKRSSLFGRSCRLPPMSDPATPSPSAPPVATGDRNERRRVQTRARILAAAQHLFATKGVEATTIRDLAAEADIALGGFYNYFRTKDDVLATLIEEGLAEQLRRLTLRQAQVDDVAERVAIAHRHLLAAAREDPEWGWLLLRLEPDRQLISAVLQEPATADLKAGLREGRFAVARPLLTLRASGGALLGVIGAVLRGELEPKDDVAHAEGVLRSYGVPAAEAAEIARRPLPPIGPPAP